MQTMYIVSDAGDGLAELMSMIITRLTFPKTNMKTKKNEIMMKLLHKKSKPGWLSDYRSLIT